MATTFSNSTNLDIQRGQLSGPERDRHSTAHRTLNKSLNPTTATNMEPHDQTHDQESKDSTGMVRQNSTRHSTRPGGPRARKRRTPRQLPAIPPIPDVGPPIRTEPRLDAQVVLASDRAPNRSPNTKQQHGTTDSRTVASTSHPERSSQQENPSSSPKPLPPIASSSKGKGKQVEKPIPSTPAAPESSSVSRNEPLIHTTPDMPPRHVAFENTVTGISQPDNAEGVCVDSDPQVKLTESSGLEEKQRERHPEEQSSSTPPSIPNLPVQRSTSFIPTVAPPAPAPYETAPPASQSLNEKPVFESAGVTSSQPVAAESVGARSTISHPAFQPVKASLPPSSVAFSVLLFVIWLYYYH
ncbi:hypothetical protein VNI00_011596 [Paramarasmius palmivorus]|uniref:Uncharacterized protein n=1 Tax=Paramarasmius palmivorus TaxID=297713 RepID=A0AAW0CEI5_9AGAR